MKNVLLAIIIVNDLKFFIPKQYADWRFDFDF